MFKILFVLAASLALAHGNGDPADTQATVLNYKNQMSPDGSYNYEYASSNGLNVAESGVGGSYAAGSYAYTAPNGERIKLSYVADETGYHPIGDHLPTPPPIPAYILKSLDYIAAHLPKKAEPQRTGTRK